MKLSNIAKEMFSLVSFEIPDELAEQIIALRFSKKFENFTIAEIITHLLNEGLKAAEEEAKANAPK